MLFTHTKYGASPKIRGSSGNAAAGCELRALSHALKGIGYPLEFFQLPNDVHWKPLGPNQSREYSDGIMFVVDKASGTKIAQLRQDLISTRSPSFAPSVTKVASTEPPLITCASSCSCLCLPYGIHSVGLGMIFEIL